MITDSQDFFAFNKNPTYAEETEPSGSNGIGTLIFLVFPLLEHWWCDEHSCL